MKPLCLGIDISKSVAVQIQQGGKLCTVILNLTNPALSYNLTCNSKPMLVSTLLLSSRALSQLSLPRKKSLDASERNNYKRAWYWRRLVELLRFALALTLS